MKGPSRNPFFGNLSIIQALKKKQTRKGPEDNLVHILSHKGIFIGLGCLQEAAKWFADSKWIVVQIFRTSESPLKN